MQLFSFLQKPTKPYFLCTFSNFVIFYISNNQFSICINFRNFIFNIINYPKLQVEIPYLNQKLIHESSISLSADINNSSGFSIRQVAGQLYRHSITITIDDAYLWDVREKGNYKISDIQLYVNDIHEEQYDL